MAGLRSSHAPAKTPPDINTGYYKRLARPVPPLQLNKGSFIGILDFVKRSGEIRLSFAFHIPAGATAVADSSWGHFALAQEILPGFGINPKDKLNIIGGALTASPAEDGWTEISVTASSVYFCAQKDVRPVYERLTRLASLCGFTNLIRLNDRGEPISIKIYC